MKYYTVTAVVFLCGFLGHTESQTNIPTADEVLQKVNSAVNIPELKGLNASALPNIEDAKNIFRQKCDKNGGPDAFDVANHAQEDMVHCLKSLVNVTELQEEMEKYKPKGELDVVFKKYCRKTPILKKCVANFTTAIEPCLEPKERENKRVIQNITDSLLSFVCFKEGDRIAIFIAAGGPECFQAKQQEIQDCANTTFGSYVPVSDPNSATLPGLDSLPSLIFGSKECTDISRLQSCMVKVLETCSDPTPANIVDSIFNFILRVTPCESLLNTQAAANSDVRSSATHAVSVLSIISIAFALLRFL